jgi:integrase
MVVCLASDEDGATVVLCSLLLALRAGEVAAIGPRSIDDQGRILRVEESKTEAGIRLIEVPEVLQPRLDALAKAPKKTRHWVATRGRRWCKLAGVTEVGPHALRGTHASLATRAGASSQLVAATLGHTSATVTEAHYTQQSATDEARQGTVLKVLAGGKR